MRPFHDVLNQLRHLADQAGVSDADLLRRFAVGGDEAAFELLVWRHGALVLNTCSRILGGSADAEDAFQATFLALVRKASGIRDGRALVGWLHHVARRVSLRALGSARGRARRERHGLPDAAAVPPDEPGGREIGAAVEEEVARLPERMRVAFVLCQLEGYTAGEAAAQLGCPEGTVLSRLSRARERLRDRLTRRGLAPEPALPRATVPAGLVTATLRSAGHFAAGRTAGFIPDSIVSLTQGVLREMFLSKLKAVAAVLALFLVAGLGGALAYAGQAGERAAPRPRATDRPREQPKEPEPKKKPEPIKLATRDKGLTFVDEALASPDGKLIVTAGNRPKGDTLEQMVLVWESATGKLVHTISQPDGTGAALAFSKDGKTLATANVGEGTITLHTVATWKVRATLKDHSMVNDLVFTPDGKTLASRSCAFSSKTVHSEVKLWDVAAGRERINLKRGENEAFHSMDLSPNGKRLAVGTSEGKVRLVDVATGKEGEALTATAGRPAVAIFSPDGKMLATWMMTGDEDKAARVVKLWDTATGKVRRTVELDKGLVRQVLFSPDSKTLAVGGHKLNLAVYDPATGKRQAAFKLSDAEFGDLRWMTFSPDGKLLAASGYELRNKPGEPRAVTKFFAPADRREVAAPDKTRVVTFAPRGGKAMLIVGDAEGTEDRKPDEVVVRDLADLMPAAKKE